MLYIKIQKFRKHIVCVLKIRKKILKHIVCVLKNQKKILKTHSMCFQKNKNLYTVVHKK